MIRNRTRTTLWVGLDGDVEDSWDIHSEDDMLAIETHDGQGNETQVFIDSALFRKIRRVMDNLEDVNGK